MVDKSWGLTLASYVVGFGLLFLHVQFNYDLDQQTITLIQSLIGGTTIGGVINAGHKRYVDMRTKLAQK